MNQYNFTQLKVDPLEAYKLYIALKNHFTKEKYDFFKYKGKVRATKKSFDNRNDKYFFAKVASKYNKDELVKLYVSNFIVGLDWIGDISNELDAIRIYNNHLQKIESISYNFNEECKLLSDFLKSKKLSFKNLIEIVDNQQPLLLQFLMKSMISLETFCILDILLNFTGYFTKNLEYDFVWQNKKRIVDGYKPFISFNKDKLKMVVKTHFK